MNLKKMLSLALAGVMALSLMACSAQNGGSSTEAGGNVGGQVDSEAQNNAAQETVTITSLNASQEAAELEVPYDPQRIAILDMASLDILDNLGLGDRVVGRGSTTLDYLQDYVTAESVANLGTIKEAAMEAIMARRPDLIFSGGR